MALRKERRRNRRINIALPVKIDYNNQRIAGDTKNIGALGVYLEIDQKIPVGTALEISIAIPKLNQAQKATTQLKCLGIVFRCQETKTPRPKNRYGMGIFFRSFLKGGEKQLSDFIAQALKQEKLKKNVFDKNKGRKK